MQAQSTGSRASHLSAQLIFKALIALYGSILFWVGLWTSLDADFFPRSLQRDPTYTAVGLAFMIGADSFYSNAGVDGRYALTKSISDSLSRDSIQLLRRFASRQGVQNSAAFEHHLITPRYNN